MAAENMQGVAQQTPAAGADAAAADAQPESTEQYILRKNAAGAAVLTKPDDGGAGQARDEHGRFVKADSGGEGQPAEGDQPPAEGKESDGAAAEDAQPDQVQLGGKPVPKADSAEGRRLTFGAEADAVQDEIHRLEVEIARKLGAPEPPPPQRRNWASLNGMSAPQALREAMTLKYDREHRLKSVQAQHAAVMGTAAGTAAQDPAKPKSAALPADDDPADPMPQYEDYDSAAEHTAALAAWSSRKEWARLKAEETQRQTANQAQEHFSGLIARYAENSRAMEAIVPNLLEEIGDLTLPRDFAEIIMESDHSALVALELARSPEMLDRLVHADDRTRAREIGKLEVKVAAQYAEQLKALGTANGTGTPPSGKTAEGAAGGAAGGAAQPVKAVSKAPAPIRPERGGATPPKAVNDMSTKELQARLRGARKL